MRDSWPGLGQKWKISGTFLIRLDTAPNPCRVQFALDITRCLEDSDRQYSGNRGTFMKPMLRPGHDVTR